MNPIRDQNYFSLDLELNNKQDGTTPRIIQVGVSIGSPVRPDDIKTFSWYLDPEEEITPFITKLTGIDNQLIKEKAVPHQIVAEELGALININKCFVNPIVWAAEEKVMMLQNSKMSLVKGISTFLSLVVASLM
jgi:DNA polymerase III alpha subunit (gram-positive type)